MTRGRRNDGVAGMTGGKGLWGKFNPHWKYGLINNVAALRRLFLIDSSTLVGMMGTLPTGGRANRNLRRVGELNIER